jgi:hypothetical protein
VKAGNAAEFLSLVPHLLGFHPTRSLVVIPFAGSRSLGAMRFDLPDDESDAIDRVASTIIGMACKVSDVDALATVIYTDAQFADESWMPHDDLSKALERRADACGLRLTDALCVAGDGWGSYLDRTCPTEGRPLADLVQPWSVGPLPEATGDQATGAALPAVDPAEKESVARALDSLDDAVTVLCGPDASGSSASRARRAGKRVRQDAAGKAARSEEPSADEPHRIDPLALAEVCSLDDLPTLFESALEWDSDSLDPYHAAAMAWCLSRPALRDIALVQWCGGLAAGDEALDAQLRWERGEEYPAHLAMHMWGEGPQPEPDRLIAALELARRVAAVAPRPSRPGPLATCAWLSWALGRSTHADLYANRACEIDPEHGLAEIVLSFVHAGHVPEWAFQRSVTRSK